MCVCVLACVRLHTCLVMTGFWGFSDTAGRLSVETKTCVREEEARRRREMRGEEGEKRRGEEKSVELGREAGREVKKLVDL